jgi:hypothetical protein
MDRVSSHSAKEFSTMQPDLILIPFGKNATPGTIDTIPKTRGPGDDPQQATWDEGFPQVTMTPLAAGGIPPKGQDFNGVLRAISEHTVFSEHGGQFKWSSDYVTESGGYSIGDVVQADDGLNSYVSLVNTNTANFNTTPASIGTSWGLYAGRNTQTQATETVAGIAEVATTSEVTTGADDSRIVTPLKLAQRLTAYIVQATETVFGWAKIATQAQTNAGTDDNTIVTPKKLRFGVSMNIAATGYLALPSWLGGLIIEWGSTSVTAGIVAGVTFPLQFPVEFLSGAILTGQPTGNNTATLTQGIQSVPTTTGMNLINSSGTVIVRWIVLGH